MRHELKYLLTPIEYTLLRERLKWCLERDRNGSEAGRYFIRSVYFDSPDRAALREKLDGVNERRKYRIRFYNGDLSFCRLECKEKTGTRILKTSCPLTEAQARALTEGGSFDADGGDDLLQTMAHLVEREGFGPVVTVDYVREAYVSPLSDLRITFDQEIAWGAVEDCFTHERYLSNVYGEHMILEVKYNEYLPEHISHILTSVSLIRTHASKYVSCVESQFAARGY